MEEAEAEMTPEPTEEAMEDSSPDELPETGMSLATGAATIPTVLLVTLALGGIAFATRRREE